MSDKCPGKNSWPELVGTNGDYAASVIQRENKRMETFVISEGDAVICDFRCDRVWVRVDNNRIVVEVPIAG